MQRDRVDGGLVSAGSENYQHRRLIGQLAREYRIPALCEHSESSESGALMAYAHDIKAGVRRIAAQIVEILNGGNPAEMPFFQETHWELVVNLKAAKELGVEVPAGLIARADEVID